jgi:hypothetical protein
MKFITFELPAFWAVALFNDDTSHFDDVDQAQFNAFTDDMVERYGKCWVVDMDEDASFNSYHDATRFGVLACDCVTYTFDITPD